MTPQEEQALVRAVLETVRAIQGDGHHAVALMVMADDCSQRVVPYQMTRIAVKGAPEWHDADDDILATIDEAGRRLSTEGVLFKMDRANRCHSERIVKGRLAELVRQGKLDNPKENGRHVGYGRPATAAGGGNAAGR